MREQFRLAVFITTFAFLLLGCARAQLEGVVQTPSGRGLADVTVEIEGSEHTTNTDSTGRYLIGYNPGEFIVRYSRKGYTTHQEQHKLTEKIKYTIPPITLYPMPEESGVYILSEDGVVSLAPSIIEKRERSESMGRRRVDYLVSPKDMPATGSGQNAFVDRSGTTIRLVKMKSTPVGYLLYQVEYVIMAGHPVYDQSMKVSDERVGLENLLIRQSDLEPGVYAWVEIDPNPIVGFWSPRKFCYPFRVSSESTAESKAESGESTKQIASEFSSLSPVSTIQRLAPMVTGNRMTVSVGLEVMLRKLAEDAQHHYRKPKSMGGGGGSFKDFKLHDYILDFRKNNLGWFRLTVSPPHQGVADEQSIPSGSIISSDADRIFTSGYANERINDPSSPMIMRYMEVTVDSVVLKTAD